MPEPEIQNWQITWGRQILTTLNYWHPQNFSPSGIPAGPILPYLAWNVIMITFSSTTLTVHSVFIMFITRIWFWNCIFFQVTKIRNIAAPKVNEESQSNPRMLKISLTDGKTKIHGVEVTKLDGINLNSLPVYLLVKCLDLFRQIL